MLEQLPIIDWSQHAEPNSPSHDMAIQLLTLFMEQLPETETNLNVAYDTNNIELAKATLHRLQGACAYCALPRLRQLVVNIHDSLKRNPHFTEQQLQLLQQEISVVKGELSKHSISPAIPQ